jgi:UDP-N-acetylmuramoyl-L-alanyl-D-glutamate--2,6-diaminopimelate ligase
VKGVESNSRLVQKGFAFVAVRGFNEDGNRYIPDAVRRGASVVITDQIPESIPEVPVVLVEDSRKALSRIAANFFGHPSRKMHIVGITGTNGKTTTSYLIESVLRGQGFRTGVIGTIRYKINDEVMDAPNTTPDSLQLQRLLSRMAAKKVDWVVMEVSSHALELHRVDDCAFDHVIFTNLTEDHFDFHKTFENYFLAKKKLFLLLKASPKKNRFAITNLDDKYGTRLVHDVKGLRFSGYSIRKPSAYRAEDISLGFNKTAFKVNGLQIDSRLSGQFNVYNILSVMAWASEAKLKKTLVVKSLEEFKAVEGRFELFSRSKGPKAIVDYAHTDDALKNVLNTINQIKTGRVITVFGCGGNRDTLKRPKMGHVADSLSDIVIVTSDNPRKENPRAIIDDILKGISRKRDLIVEVDRLTAIRKAFTLAKAADVILIAGKGHEDYQIFKDRTIHFSDREIAAKLLKDQYG